MALDLFANYERASNNSLFYRPVSNTPHDVVFKLFDDETPNLDLTDYYQAEYTIDGSIQRSPMAGLQFCLQIGRSVPTTRTITVYVSSLNPFEPFGTYTLSAKYVSQLPEANFIAYPTYVIDETVGTIKTLNSTNYFESSGVYFYGEGHTETINLSSNYSTAIWFVGNSLSAIEGFQSDVPVISNINNQTATVVITSSPALEKIYDISLQIVNSEIVQTGPIFTYEDEAGVKLYYPFFCSTLSSDDCTPSILNNKLRNSIEVKPYPIVENYSMVSQLSGTPGAPMSLPYDFSNKRFLARVQQTSNETGFLTEPLYATQWELEAVADAQEPNPDWSSATVMYPAITGYSFPLAYYNQNNIDDFIFKCSAGFDTTVTTTVSVYKSTEIYLPPFDWECRTTALVISDRQPVAGMPVGRFYTSSYYYLTGEEIKFYNITEGRYNINVTSVVLSSERLDQPLVFNSAEVCSESAGTICYKTATYNDIGTVTLSATIHFVDSNSQPQSITTVLEDFIEIVPYYDQLEQTSYRSIDSSPSALIESYPRISPNEWVTENNINSIFVKFDYAIEELKSYARAYNTENPIIGRLEPAPEYEGTCLGTDCLDWSWGSRKCGNSTTYTTWANTKCTGEYSATWAPGTCEQISLLECSRAPYWLVPTIEPNEFNQWMCTEEDEGCKYVGIAKLEVQDKIVVAYKTELHLLDNDYFAKTLEKHPFVDEVFTFFNLVGIAKTTDDMIAVLDSSLPRVSVFTIDSQTNKFTLYSTWGRYGLSNSKTGFNKPQDIHIDQHNNVWICDTGNNCVKKLTITGRHIATIQNDKFEENAPVSICVDSDDNLHCLTENSSVLVFNKDGNLSFEYFTPEGIVGTKINTNYNKESVYVTYDNGIIKYFKTGVLSHYIIKDYNCSYGPDINWSWDNRECGKCKEPQGGLEVTWNEMKLTGEYETIWDFACDIDTQNILKKFSSITQDEHRNIYVTLNNMILKIVDRMILDDSSYEGDIETSWDLNSILIDKEEYIQPWVYLKSFHRLWDNIELFRSSLFYEAGGCKGYVDPMYLKEDLKLGQNEIVTNAAINRLSEQLWANLQSVAKYFDPNCLDS